MLTHVHVISTKLSAGAYSENVILNQAELAYILIIPGDSNNTYTFRITSPSSNIIFTALVTGRLYRETAIPVSGTYTLAVAGATVLSDTLKGEIGMRR